MGCVGDCFRGHFELVMFSSMTLSIVLGFEGAFIKNGE